MPTAYDFIIKQGDTLPILTDTLTYSNGDAVDLTEATVQFVLRSQNAPAPTVNAAATVTDASTGSIEYLWSAADTAAPGLYEGTWIVTFPDSAGQMSFPTDGYLDVAIEANLTSTTGPTQLVSISDAKDVLNIPASDRTNDAKILRWIRSARPVIEQLCGPIIPQQFEEWHDGGQTYIMVRRRPSTGYGTSPILTVQAISEYQGPIEWTQSIVASPDWGQLYSVMVDVRLGRIVRRTAGGGVQAFPNMPQAVHVIYTSGQQSVPDNVYEGTLEMLRVNYQQTAQGRPPAGSGGAPDDETPREPFVGFFIPGRVRELLAPNRRYPSLA